MDIWPLSFFWIDQNEDIASAMCWRWLQTLGKRCVAKAHEMQVDRLYVNGKPGINDVYAHAYGWNYGIYAAEMDWLELYTYPGDVDQAPKVLAIGLEKAVQTTPRPITLHCAIIHTLIGVPGSFLDELDTWNNALITSHLELCEPVYPSNSNYQWPAGFSSWRYLAFRAMREWEYKHANRSAVIWSRKRL